MPFKNRLPRFLIGGDAEGRVLLRQAMQRHAHLFLVGLGFRFDGDFDDGIREDHLFEYDR